MHTYRDAYIYIYVDIYHVIMYTGAHTPEAM